MRRASTIVLTVALVGAAACIYWCVERGQEKWQPAALLETNAFLESWKASLANAQAEFSELWNALPDRERYQRSSDVGYKVSQDVARDAGITDADWERAKQAGEDGFLGLVRSPRYQQAAMDKFLQIANIPLQWDKVHRCAEPEKWLSPVYRIISSDYVRLDPSVFLAGRIQFVSNDEYLKYAGADVLVVHLALARSERLLAWVAERRNVVPSTSCDIMVQTLFTDTGRMMGDGKSKMSAESKARLQTLVACSNPTYRLMALSLSREFESDPAKRIGTCQRAKSEINQVFWKIALENLAEIGGEQAVQVAREFRLQSVILSDGTAFADDADVKKEIELLVRAVEARPFR